MAIALRQATFADLNGTSATSITATFSSGTLAGSIIVACASISVASLTLTITDGNSDAYTDSGPNSVSNATEAITTRIGAFFTPTTGTTTVKVAYSPTQAHGTLFIYEVTGLTSAQFDKVVHANGTGTAGSSGSTGTLSNAAEFAVGFGGQASVGFSAAGASPWATGQGSVVGSNLGDGIDSDGNICEHQITAATTALTGTATETAGGGWTMWCATIQSGTATTVAFEQRHRGPFNRFGPRRGPGTGKGYVEVPSTAAQIFSQTSNIAILDTITLIKQTNIIKTISLLDTITTIKQTGKILTPHITDTITTIKQSIKNLSITLLDTFLWASPKSFGKFVVITLLDTITLVNTQIGKIITPNLVDTVSTLKQTGKNLTIILHDTITLIKQTGKILTPLITDTISLIKQTGKIITNTLLDAFSWASPKSFGKFITIALLNTFSRLNTQINKITSITLLDTITTIKQIGKIIITTLLDTITTIQLKVKLFTIPTINIIDTISKNNIIGKTTSILLLDTITALKQVGKILTPSIIVDTISLIKQTGKIITTTLLDTFSWASPKSFGKFASIPLTDTISLIKQVGKIVATFNITDTITALRQSVRNLSVSITLHDTISLIKQTGHIINIILLDTITKVVQVAHNIAILLLDTFTSTQLKVKLFTVPTIVINDVILMSRQTSKIITPLLLNTITLIKQTGHFISVGLVDTITKITQIGHKITITLLDTVTILPLKAKLLTIPTITINDIIMMVRQTNKTISASLLDIITTIKQIGKTITNTLLDTILLTTTRQIIKLISIVLLDTITKITQIGHKLTITLLDTFTSTQLKVKLFTIPTITINNTILSIKQTGKIISSTLLDTVKTIKQIGHTISIALIDTMSYIRAIGHIINVNMNLTIISTNIKQLGKLITTTLLNTTTSSMLKVFLKTIIITLSDIVSIIAQFSHFSGNIYNQIAQTFLTITPKIAPIRTLYQTIITKLHEYITIVATTAKIGFIEYSTQFRNIVKDISATWNKDA